MGDERCHLKTAGTLCCDLDLDLDGFGGSPGRSPGVPQAVACEAQPQWVAWGDSDEMMMSMEWLGSAAKAGRWGWRGKVSRWQQVSRAALVY